MNLFIFLVSILLYSVLTSQAYAQTPSCTLLFGGGQTCVQDRDFSVNKQVQEPGSKDFRDNLTATSNRFTSGQTITFRITIKNTANGDLSNLTITDTIPRHLTYTKGDGTFDKSNQTFSAKIDKLEKGKSKTLTLVTTVITADKLPSVPSPLCLSNQASAKVGNKTSTDITTFCVNNEKPTAQTQITPGNTKGGLPVFGQISPTQTPGTGGELLSLLSLPTFGALGYFLRNKYNV